MVGSGALLTGGLSAATEAGFLSEKEAGNAALREGRYADAVTHYTLAEELNPVSPIPPANRALAHLKAKSFAAASADVTVAIALQDAAPRAEGHDALRVKLLLRRATARTEMTQLQMAAQDLAQVLALQPGHERALRELRVLRDRHGVVPQEAGARAAPGITVMEDVSSTANGNGANGNAARIASSTPAQLSSEGANELVHDFPLMNISDSSVIKNLTSKWAEEPPKNLFEFERAWKSLRGNESERAKYLILVGEARVLNGIFGHSLTAQMLHEFVIALSHGGFADACFRNEAARVLHAVSRIPRFDIAVLLMSAEEKNDVKRLVSRLNESGIQADLVQKLRIGFQLSG